MSCRLLVLRLGFLAVASPSIAQTGSHAGSGRCHSDSSHKPKVSKPKVGETGHPHGCRTVIDVDHRPCRRANPPQGASKPQTVDLTTWIVFATCSKRTSAAARS